MGLISYITRAQTFSAAHRLHSPHLTNEENLALYGKCNNSNYHGHNYRVEVTLRGDVHPATGMVMNLVSLKECIQLSVLDPLDHKNLDVEVEFFRQNPSTTENLAIFIWKNFKHHLLSNPSWSVHATELYKVKVCETDANSVEYFGEGEPENETQTEAPRQGPLPSC
ncbi:hypothetical protein BDF14DRAFT_1854007 [Spinellus fusiger]|nr:hypothetical protein BDF14DRAFT_1854007 [Spinellus fusiger]